MHILGMWGMPRRIYTYGADMGWTHLNQLETVGAFILGIAFLLFYINIFKSLISGERRPPIRGTDAASNGPRRRRRRRTTSRRFRKSAAATRGGF